MGTERQGADGRDGFDLDVIWDAERYQRWIVASFDDAVTGRVLEVGAGVGAVTRWLAARAEHVTALEPHAGRCAAVGRLSLPNVTTWPASVEDLASTEKRWDAGVLVNVLEHLDDDVAALRAVARVLRSGGTVAVLVPAHAALFGALDERYGHRRRYSARDVRQLLLRAGLEPLRIRYFNPVGAVGWLMMGRVLRRSAISPTAVRFAERVIVPVGQAIERLGAPPLGQSVVAVARVNADVRRRRAPGRPRARAAVLR